MKNVKLIIAALICLVIFPVFTSAESIINNNGIVITEEEYNNFEKVFTHARIMTMSEEQYEKYKTLDYSNITKEEKYIETTYNRSLNLTTERELTKEEYDNYPSPNSRLASDSQYYESTAKRLSLVLMGGSTYNYVTLNVNWKYIPTTRSYDVIGFRGYDFEFRDGSQIGEQIYYLDGSYHVINYAWDGTNIKRFDNGFGISMNIVNSDIDELQLYTECDVEPTSNYPAIYGSYQHAVNSVSLANSQNYTLGGSGLGNVFVFPYSISQKYDGMTGVYLQY